MDFINWITTAIGLSIGLCGLVFGYIFYRRSHRRKLPCWAIRTNNLIYGTKAHLNGLDIKYKDKRIENLSISKILLWNQGNEPVRINDIAAEDPLRIAALGDTRLMQVEVITKNNDANKFSVTPPTDNEKSAYLKFDFLDKGDGAVLQIIHTGTSSEDLQVLGWIIGAGKTQKTKIPNVRELPFWIPNRFANKFKSKTKRMLKGLDMVLWPLILITVIISTMVTGENSNWEDAVVPIIVVSFMMFILIWVSRYLLWGPKTPTGLETFDEE